MSFTQALISNPLLQTALLAGLLASFASGIIGSYVVVKRIVFISGSIAHSILGGLGLFLWIQRTYGLVWLSPLHGALLAGILAAIAIGWIHLRYRQREDSVIAALWSTGMAIGVIFISITPGSNVELSNYLIGNILWVSKSDLWMLFSLDLLIIATVIFLYQKLLILCFDEEQALMQGVPVEKLYYLLLVLVAISVVLLMQIVGIILVITMLTLPATIANLFTKKLSYMMFLATILGTCFCLIGLTISYEFEWPPGATIALFAGICYLISLLSIERQFRLSTQKSDTHKS